MEDNMGKMKTAMSNPEAYMEKDNENEERMSQPVSEQPIHYLALLLLLLYTIRLSICYINMK